MSRQSAITLVFDPQDHVLVLRRGATDPWKPGHWNFPGGKVDKTDASVRQGAVRELHEEAGIVLPPNALNWAFSFKSYGLVHVFWVQLPRRPSVHSNDGEHDAYDWVSLHRVPRPVIPRLPFVVHRFQSVV